MDEFWKGRPVLVTGAGGFIASHLVESLADMGARLRLFVRYNSRGDPGLLKLLPRASLERAELISGDLRDLPAVQASVQGMATVLHLGALISIPYSYRHPQEVVESNILGTLNVLLACRASGVERLVHTSSSEVYGSALHIPIDENHPLQGQSPYSASKIGADKLAESFYRAYDLPVVTLRPFNTYGPRQSARAVIPTIISQALTGDKIRLGALETRRDFTYVSDTVRGILLAAQIPGIEGETFNLGLGEDVSIGDLAREVIDLTHSSAQIELDAQRLRPEKSEVQRLVADNRLARQRLGWQPELRLRQGLSQTIAWMRQNLDFYQPDVYHF
jgi:dTDP-glucose 4,6-dehydratase